MENRVKWLVYVLVVVAALGGGYFYLRVQPPGAESPSPSVALASFTNAKGEEWFLPEGDVKFSVSADRSITPSFLWGEILPLKVKVGDTQKLRVIVGDKVPVKSVMAEFETDTRKWNVPLRFVRTEARASPETAALEARYSVDKDGFLVANDAATIAKATETGIIPSAYAQDMVRYVFEGEWKVEDTHTKTYHTIFTAENERGEKNTLVMAWSDPNCKVWGGVLQAACTITSGNEGWENSSASPVSLGSGKTITLSGASAQFLANSISLANGGSITISNGAIKIGSLYMGTDADGDLVPATIEPQTSGSVRYYNVFFSETDGGYRNPTAAASTNIVSAPVEKVYTFIDELIRKVFAVGPCPGHPSCPPASQTAWTSPTNIYAADGSLAFASNPTNSTEYLKAYTYGFSIPATVGTSTAMASFEVTVRARVDTGAVKMSAFVGNWGDQQVGSEVTVSNTSLQDFVFGGPTEREYAFTPSTVNGSNFGVWLQAYDGTGTIYVDQIKLRVYYKMGPGNGDANDSVASNTGLGSGFVTGSHTMAQCSSAGGTSVNIGGQNAICRFNGLTIPGGWTQYGNWSQTTANTCSGLAAKDFDNFTFVPSVYAACSSYGCTTGSHTWANIARESCAYNGPAPACVSEVCEANFTYRGAY